MSPTPRVLAEAVVQETLSRDLYRVALAGNPRHKILAQASGRAPRLRLGARVTVEIDPHHAGRGQILHTSVLGRRS